MKALVQRIASGEYFAGGAAWSNQKSNAYLFDDAVSAMRFINGIRGVRVLIFVKTKSEPVLLFETPEDLHADDQNPVKSPAAGDSAGTAV